MDKTTKRLQTFCDLVARQKPMDLAQRVYTITGQMPSSERFELTNQMRRAVASIPSNIAEGYARQRLADYLRFLRIARASLAELATQIELAQRMKMLSRIQNVTELISEEDRILQGLIRSLETKAKQHKASA